MAETPMTADEWKAKGNAAFSAGNFDEAAELFSKAIDLDPANHVLFSNRSAAYASEHKYAEALQDAEKAVSIKPDWPKGYSRTGAALVGLQRLGEAVEAYKAGLKVDPSNEALQVGLDEAEAALAASQRPRGGPVDDITSIFSGPELWSKLAQNAKTRSLLAQPDLVAKVQEIQRDSKALGKHIQDPRILAVMSALMGIDIRTATDEEMAAEDMKDSATAMEEESAAARRASGSAEPMDTKGDGAAKAASNGDVKMADDDGAAAMDDEVDPEIKQRKAEAASEKEKGNVAYKARSFDEAIEHYTKAIELDGSDVTFYTNRAAVYLEKGDYDKCIEDCDTAVEKGREIRADYTLIAKALTRKGNALVKKAKSGPDYAAAVEVYQKALTEHRNAETLKRLNVAEKLMKEKLSEEYNDPALAEKEREKGNELFKKNDYAAAVKAYTEAIKRDPKDHRSYSNRAACYTKLLALNEAIKDADKCIEMAPDFVKGYSRKGAAQFFMKEYEKAMETYREGLKLEPENAECKEGIVRCVTQLQRMASGHATEEELKERRAKALADPEVQQILQDPIMRQVLSDFEQDPSGAQRHLLNPTIRHNLEKLMTGGIVQMK